MRRLFVLSSLVACAKDPRNVYLSFLDEQTDLAVVYDGFATALRIRGTYLSDTFRTVMADERRRLFGATDAEHAAYVARMADDASAYHEVVFTAESDIETHTEFGATDDRWRVRLLADGAEQPLVTVYKVREPTALQEQLFAHLNLWNELWVARFARTVHHPDEVRLEVGSGWGHQTLVWSGDAVR